MNPYNCTIPGNLFVGHEDLRKKLLNGFRNGNSYAVIGGRRCGKTSLLMQIEKDLQKEGLSPFHPIPRRFSLQEHGRSLTPDQLFEKIYNLVTQDIKTKPWKKSEPGKEYQNFLKHLDTANPILNEQYSPDWLIILLIDEMDAAVSYLPDDQFFQNLRHFLMESRFNRHFRLVATGVKEMARLISSGSSPLNNLRNTYLRILTNKEAQQLVNFGFHQRCDTYGELEYMFQLTGRHPFILQGILEELWTSWDYEIIKTAALDFLRQHKDFHHWLNTFEPAEKEVYNYLAKSQQGKITLKKSKTTQMLLYTIKRGMP